ncbi:MAG: ubiquinone/menaquinone biosynthesis methyltransferase [Acidobacteriia bacterium]|nr:ubiquinone/menaquinone biosynthesis methyltransferase [Terriglobia bacterium]
MFGAIARRYDLLNRVLSLGRDVGWRRVAAAEAAGGSGGAILDLCSGTGDLAAELAGSRKDALVVCADFARPMLVRARAKLERRGLVSRCLLLEADALSLPFRDGAFAAVAVAFGVRNLADLGAGLREILRVLRPGGRLVVLEFSRPTSRALSGIYGLYLNRVLPGLGDRVSGQQGPYGYLARTIAEFPDPPEFAGVLREAGFAAAGWTPLTGGIVCVHTAIKGA